MPLTAEDECTKCNAYNIDVLLDKQLPNQRIIVYHCKTCNHIEVESLKNNGISYTYELNNY